MATCFSSLPPGKVYTADFCGLSQLLITMRSLPTNANGLRFSLASAPPAFSNTVVTPGRETSVVGCRVVHHQALAASGVKAEVARWPS